MEPASARSDYRIVDVDGQRVLSVVCGGVALYEFRTALTPAEYAAIVASGRQTPALVEAIRNDPRAFAARELPPPG